MACRGHIRANNLSILKDDLLTIESLPPEILYLIYKRLDCLTLVKCFHVCKRWRTIVIDMARGDKTNQLWRSIYKLYHEDDTFENNSDKLLSYQHLLENTIRWHYDCLFTLSDSKSDISFAHLNTYRDNIILINQYIITYLDMKTFDVKKIIHGRDKCEDFRETDVMVIKIIIDPVWGSRTLHLRGKMDPADSSWEQDEIVWSRGVLNQTLEAKSHYTIEQNYCYCLQNVNKHSLLIRNEWVANEGIWKTQWLCKHYGPHVTSNSVLNVLNSEVFLLHDNKLFYCNDKQKNFQKIRVLLPTLRTRQFGLPRVVQLVHKYSVVMRVPDDRVFRIFREKDNEFDCMNNTYRLECPKLTCATPHGEMLLLGFSDGRIELIMPKAASREEIFKQRILLSDFKKDTKSQGKEINKLAVTSINVYEDFEQHIIIATTISTIFRFTVSHSMAVCLLDDIPLRPLWKPKVQNQFRQQNNFSFLETCFRMIENNSVV